MRQTREHTQQGADKYARTRQRTPGGGHPDRTDGGHVCQGLMHRPLRRRTPGQHPIRARIMAGVAVGITLEVVLVLRLRLPEIADGLDLRDDLARPQTRSVDIGDRLQCRLFLRLVNVVDRGTVGRAPVIALAIEGGGVVNLKKYSNRRRYEIRSGSNSISMPSACVPWLW